MIDHRCGAARAILQAICVVFISISGGAALAQSAEGGMPGPTLPQAGATGVKSPDCPQIARICALIADPAVRDYVGPAEYAWDFNAPDPALVLEAVRPSISELRLARSGGR